MINIEETPLNNIMSLDGVMFFGGALLDLLRAIPTLQSIPIATKKDARYRHATPEKSGVGISLLKTLVTIYNALAFLCRLLSYGSDILSLLYGGLDGGAAKCAGFH
ncbi:hypothetical protein [Leminorella grimontii]|uniref:hypothetical protein n=1 Tax=Leminorella grimontii TaxID=82981 RepID=UPI00322061F8